MAKKKFEQYTRSEMTEIKKILEQKQNELYEHIGMNPDAGEWVKDAIRKEAEHLRDVIGQIDARLATMYSSCIFCKERVEAEVPTITHICAKCDARVFGRGK